MLINEFINYLRFQKRYSFNTLIAYQNDLERFFLYIKSNYGDQDLEAITHFMIRSWIVELMEAGLKPISIQRKLSSLKSYYKFLLKNTIVKINPLNKVISPKSVKSLPSFIEESKLNNLLNNMKLGKGFSEKRNQLIIELFYLTGIRLSELINIKEKDLDLVNLSLKVLGKGNKERIIPINSSLRKIVAKYIVIKNEIFTDLKIDNFLFLKENGKKMHSKFVYNIVFYYLSSVVTINKKSPHILRHTFATHMLNNGSDINTIKELLGHSNLLATQIYTHNSIENLKKVYKQAHPKAKKGGINENNY
ncbi:MAG: tyrosine-type recombinase/integrase [Bacteroidota bacterium]